MGNAQIKIFTPNNGLVVGFFLGGSRCFYKGKDFMGYGDLGNFGKKSVLSII